jgi:hypothetical protein
MVMIVTPDGNWNMEASIPEKLKLLYTTVVVLVTICTGRPYSFQIHILLEAPCSEYWKTVQSMPLKVAGPTLTGLYWVTELALLESIIYCCAEAADISMAALEAGVYI